MCSPVLRRQSPGSTANGTEVSAGEKVLGPVGSQLSNGAPCIWSATGASSTCSSVNNALLCNGDGFEAPNNTPASIGWGWKGQGQSSHGDAWHNGEN